MSYMYDQDEKHFFYSGKRHLEEEEESINCLTKKNLKLDNQRLEFELNLQKKKYEVYNEVMLAAVAIKETSNVIKSYYEKKSIKDFASNNFFLDSLSP